MEAEHIVILEHLLLALAAGGLIGFERSFHGRPAGFRTHTLVCVASSALMLVTMYQSQWYPEAFAGRVALDPTRMAQGIMTGIGFLGAGVIFKEGLTVRGLTTAASIWITAAIGILAGIGFYFPMLVATGLTLLTLSLFRWIENKVPSESYAHLDVRFGRDAAMSEDDLRQFIGGHGFSIANLSYRYSAEASYFQYQMVIRTRQAENVKRLTESMRGNKSILEFRIYPAGD
ncbi:MAG: MgtC/SapB family protein [Betaproteobacteria bacterium]|nr:MgtC/SapB family protein [Betaproteobacteria bacterium]